MTRDELAKLREAVRHLMRDTDDPAGGFHDGMEILSDLIRRATRTHAQRPLTNPRKRG